MARRRARWSGVVVLVLVGVAVAMARTVRVADATVRVELTMREVFPALARRVPDPDARMRDVTEFDRRFGRHPFVTRLHTIGGAVFLILAPLQFVAPLRGRFVRLLPLLFLPLAIPLVVGGVGASVSPEAGRYLAFLALYDAIFSILCWASFEYVVSE